MKNKKLLIAAALLVVIAVSCAVFSLTREKSYDFKITVPAGNSGAFAYSNVEISPKGRKLTLAAKQGLDDCEIVLKPVEVKEENAYEPAYITPGMEVKMDVEKRAWFQVGVNMENPTEEDVEVYVTIKNVELIFRVE